MVPTCTLLIMKICSIIIWFIRRIRLRTYLLLLAASIVLYCLVDLYFQLPITARSGAFILHTATDIHLTNKNPDGSPDSSETIETNGHWTVEGWDYYAKSEDFDHVYPNHKGIFGNELFNGIWIPTEHSNLIHLSQFQYEFAGLAPPLPIAIGLRFYAKGDAGLEIEFSYKSIKLDEKIRILPHKTNSTREQAPPGVCNKFLEIPSRNIDEIVIKGILPKSALGHRTLGHDSIVALDKIVVTLGSDTTRRNLLYTFLPNNWCSHKGILFQSPELIPVEQPNSSSN